MSGSGIDLLSIITPADPSYVVVGLSATECMSRPFSYLVDLDSGSAPLDPDTLLDQPFTIQLADTANGRYFSGIVATVKQMPVADSPLFRYQLTVVPRLWFLSQTKASRFFHNQTVPVIVEAVLGKFGVTYDDMLTGTYDSRVYTVQHNETYLHFVQRLLEDEGIFYFFSHTDSGHTMVLADSKSAFTAIPNPNVTVGSQTQGSFDLMNWHREDNTTYGGVTVDDYDPTTGALAPGAVRGTSPTVLLASGASNRGLYHWPAVRANSSDSQDRAKWHIQAAEAAAQTFSGSGNPTDFVVGGKITVTNDPTLAEPAETNYVLRAVTYAVTDVSNGGGGGGVSMDCLAFPMDTPWRDMPVHAPPVMAGVYTALVIGPSGEEIYTDDLGRIKLWFPWDQEGDITPDNTFWARVMQPWGGTGWGTQFIPRVDMEVIVAFLEGDVNRPMVVGSVFNGTNTPIFASADKNKSGIRTRSTTQGGDANCHELSFDDTKGSELFFLHAEKDYTLEVENDQTLTIQNNRNVTVTKDETVTISGKHTATVTGDHTTTVSQGDHALTVSQGNQTVTVSQGNRTVEVTAGNESLKVDAGTITNQAGQSITLKVGANSIVIDTSAITLTVGANSVKIDATGVTVSGTMVTVSGTAKTAISGAILQLSGDGEVQITGAMTMIN